MTDSFMDLLSPGLAMQVHYLCKEFSSPPKLEFGLDDFATCFTLTSTVRVATADRAQLYKWFVEDNFDAIRADLRMAFCDLWNYHNAIE